MKTESKIEIKVFQQAYVDKLFRETISTNNFESYKQERFPFEDRYARGSTGIFITEGFELDPSKGDLENSKTLYNELKMLNETQASNERLWVYLTHAFFWNYMRVRWPMEKPVEGREVGRLRDRYFLRNQNLESLTRNGISRLWWSSHLTYDDKSENPFELTEILLKRADLSVGILERGLGSNRNTRTALLEFFRDHPPIASSENRTREVLKGMNLVGGVRNLPFLDVLELKGVLEQVKTQI